MEEYLKRVRAILDAAESDRNLSLSQYKNLLNELAADIEIRLDTVTEVEDVE